MSTAQLLSHLADKGHPVVGVAELRDGTYRLDFVDATPQSVRDAARLDAGAFIPKPVPTTADVTATVSALPDGKLIELLRAVLPKLLPDLLASDPKLLAVWRDVVR